MLPKKKLLFLTDVYPFPFDRGQRVRVHNLVAACSRVFDVTFVGPPPSRAEDGRVVREMCERTVYVKAPARGEHIPLRALARAVRAAPGLPRPTTVRMYLPFAIALEQLDLDAFDFVWAERLHIARLCPSLGSRTIVDLDDLEHVKIERRLKLLSPSMELAHEGYRYALYRFSELNWSKRFVASIVCSSDDRAYLEQHGVGNVFTIPNGVTLPERTREPRAASAPGAALRVAFLGNLEYPPNADAVEFFASEVLPLLRARYPQASFDVIGPGVSPELVVKYASRVNFRGFVDDLGAALAEYDVLAAPIRFGGGTKLKVLDAMAHRIPLVTTPVGAEGLTIEHGRHALIAESGADFAAAIAKVKGDPALAASLVASAYELVRDRFSWSKIQADAAHWLSSVESPR